MRNLKCVHHTRHKHHGNLPCVATTWDTSTDRVVFALGPVKDHAVIELRRTPEPCGRSDENITSEPSLIASWDASSPIPDLEVDFVVSLQYLAATESICLVLGGGDIVIVHDNAEPDQERIEIVGSVDAGITAAAWSFDQDLLAITTRAETLLFMTADFENVASVLFSPNDVTLSKQVSVGWGKAETQFKGKRARAVRDPTMPERVDKGTLYAHDSKDVSISWRGDGAFVAVNSVEGNSRRMTRVYSREGVLDGVTEPVDGMTGALSWKPSGQLIAGIQHLGDQARVIFFERNGLRHGEFDLRLRKESARENAHQISLSWNIDATVLAVCFEDCVQLWTTGNYHYYMKQEIELDSASPWLLPIGWHPEEALRFSMRSGSRNTTSGGIGSEYESAIQCLHYVHAPSTGPTTPPNDIGNVAVIDGRTLRLTPMRLANIPPPMALHEIELVDNAVDAAFSSDNQYLAILYHDSAGVFACSEHGTAAPDPKLHKTWKLPTTPDLVAAQICFGSDESIQILLYNLGSASTQLYSTDNGGMMLSKPVGKINLLGPTLDDSQFYYTADQQICISRNDEAMKDRSSDDLWREHRLPIAPVKVEACVVEDSTLIFGLTANGTLYANQRTLVRNCTSFLLTTSHLILTTTKHLLKFVHLTNTNDLVVPEDKPEEDERCRNIERGARLVTVMPSAYSVVLQMPRGNLETIYPRALVLAGIRNAIAVDDYRKAFLACRNHRVDMNILHDHDPQRFLRQVERIINQLRKVDYIDVFLSQLSEHDISKTLYKDTVPINAKAEASQATSDTTASKALYPKMEDSLSNQSKVNRICNAFLTVLEKHLSNNLQNVITANLCKSPPDIEAGLRVVLSLDGSNESLVDTAIEHICFLADTNKIYEIALGMYKLDLALLIAQQSQKDPKEYLPYLQKLQDIEEESRRKFQIDNDLGRKSKALAHLHGVADLDEFLKYTEKYELYQQALQIVKYDQKQHDAVMRAFAVYLSTRSRFRESAIAHESLNAHLEASEAYRACNAWRESLASASLASPALPQSLFKELAEALADSLEESKDYHSAATIRLDYLDDVPGATRTFCKGCHFAEAIRLVGWKGRSDLLGEVIDPGLGEGFATLSELLAECKGQLGAQVPRLRELRAIKAKDPLAFLTGTAPENNDIDPNAPDIPDDISLAPSTTSTTASTLLTRYTARTTSTLATGTSRKTSKNRKREERKRARGKKGSVYEEEYLVNSVGRLVERVNESGEEVGRCVECLCRRGMWGRAEALEGLMREVVGLCEGVLGEVWEVDKEQQRTRRGGAEVGAEGDAARVGDMLDGGGAGRPFGAEGVLWDSLEEARRGRTPPVVKPYTPSLLLNR